MTVSFVERSREILSAIAEPISDEKRRLLEERWNELPPELQVDRQVTGRQIVHCSYTMGPAYCSFGCTHCYLPANANRTPLPTLEEMKAQIDANRRLMGPNGALQVTGGDVVDAYWQAGRAEELVEILRYASEAGVVPMLMTHGQVLLENPEYFAELVVRGQLRKIAIHIDVTQAGRPGYPIRSIEREADLNPLREEFVELILEVRRMTGVRFGAAHTVTVTAGNLDSIGEILQWLTADPRRMKAFGMISFQTEADVGRTRFSENPVTPETVWRTVCEALGRDLDRGNLWFGHPDCSNWTMILVRPSDGKVANLIPSDPETACFWKHLLEVFGGVGSRGSDHLKANAQRFGQIARHPAIVLHALRYAFGLMRRERIGAGLLLDLLRGRAGPLNVVMHNFMSREELERGGPVVESRIQACSFRGAVERDGEWVAVPMCSMNVSERETIYQTQIAAHSARPTSSTARRSLPVVV